MRKDLAETTEFYVPEEGLDVARYIERSLAENATQKQARLRKQAIHHLGRYTWAMRVLADLPPGRILDVACGAGYGSRMLAEALPDHQVVGGDYDARAVDLARKTYGGLPNLSFDNVDIVTWTELGRETGVGAYDYVVCFDTIEHLLHRDIFLVNVTENLKPAGMLFLSTPVHRQNVLNPGWEHHKIEYGQVFLYNLMSRFFAEVRIPDNGTLPHLDFWTDVINKGETRYLLRANPMLCSHPIQRGLARI